MLEYIKRITKLDDLFSMITYIVVLIAEIVYMALMLTPGYIKSGGQVFDIIYYATSAASVVLNLALIEVLIRKRDSFWRKNLLLILIIMEIAVIATDIVFALINGGFWVDGYIWIIETILVILVYSRRLISLKITESSLYEGDDHE